MLMDPEARSAYNAELDAALAVSVCVCCAWFSVGFSCVSLDLAPLTTRNWTSPWR